MATSWKARHKELADAVREEREARKVGGHRLRGAVARVEELLSADEGSRSNDDDANQE